LALYTIVTLYKVNIIHILYPDYRWLDAFFKYYFSLIEDIDNSSFEVYETNGGLSLDTVKSCPKLYKALGELNGRLYILIKFNR